MCVIHPLRTGPAWFTHPIGSLPLVRAASFPVDVNGQFPHIHCLKYLDRLLFHNSVGMVGNQNLNKSNQLETPPHIFYQQYYHSENKQKSILQIMDRMLFVKWITVISQVRKEISMIFFIKCTWHLSDLSFVTTVPKVDIKEAWFVQ